RELEAGRRPVGEMLVAVGEPFFQGLCPDFPLMPRVLIVEAPAQTGCVAALSLPENRDKLAISAGIDKVRFKRPVLPGDTLRLEIQLDKIRRGIGRGSGTATVDGQLACTAELLFALRDRG